MRVPARTPFAKGLVMVALLAAGASATAQEADLDALELADRSPDEAVQPSDWRRFVELGAGAATRRSDGAVQVSRRLSVDLQYDHSVSADWRVSFASRVDLAQPAPASGEHAVLTLKEAYASWRVASDTLLDLGRINVRNGVAMGYNPTDFFRAGAVRAAVSVDPASLKENRLGSLMLRGQQLWDGGSLTALYSPALQNRANPEGLAFDAGATNASQRALLSLSQRVAGFTPQVLLYQEEARPTRLGFNLTGLLDDATVAHLEWSGGRSADSLTNALSGALAAQGFAGLPAARGWHDRVSAGLTYTTPWKLSLTGEYQYDGTALDRGAWTALRQGPPQLYGLYRNALRVSQDLPTRRAWFARAQWQDAFVPRLDLSLMHNLDAVDWSRRLWLEVRYRGERADYALQWQRQGGPATSTWGALPESGAWFASLRLFF